jgi:hypothetical protein
MPKFSFKNEPSEKLKKEIFEIFGIYDSAKSYRVIVDDKMILKNLRNKQDELKKVYRKSDYETCCYPETKRQCLKILKHFLALDDVALNSFVKKDNNNKCMREYYIGTRYNLGNFQLSKKILSFK